MIKSPGKQHSRLKRTNCIRSDYSCRETCESFLKDCNSDLKRTTLAGDRKRISSTEKPSGVSLKVSQPKQCSQQLKEKLPETEIPKSNSLIFGFSWKRRNPEKLEKVLMADKKEMFLDLQKISRKSTVRCFKSEGSRKELDRGPTGFTMRSYWL